MLARAPLICGWGQSPSITRASINNLSENRIGEPAVAFVRPDAFTQAAWVAASSFAQLSGVAAYDGVAIANDIPLINNRVVHVAGKVGLRIDHL